MSKVEIKPQEEEPPRYEGWIGDESSGRPEVTPQTDKATSLPVEEELRGTIHIPADWDS